MEKRVIFFFFNGVFFPHDDLETTFISLVYTVSEVYQQRNVYIELLYY